MKTNIIKLVSNTLLLCLLFGCAENKINFNREIGSNNICMMGEQKDIPYKIKHIYTEDIGSLKKNKCEVLIIASNQIKSVKRNYQNEVNQLTIPVLLINSKYELRTLFDQGEGIENKIEGISSQAYINYPEAERFAWVEMNENEEENYVKFSSLVNMMLVSNNIEEFDKVSGLDPSIYK